MSVKSSTYELTLDEEDYSKEGVDPDGNTRLLFWVCADGLRNYFNVPEGAETIWVTLSNHIRRPTKDAVHFRKIRFWSGDIERPAGHRPKYERISLYSQFANVLREVGDGGSCWMRVSYK